MQQQMAAMQQLVRANPMMAMAASQMAGAAAAAGNPMASMMQQVGMSVLFARFFPSLENIGKLELLGIFFASMRNFFSDVESHDVASSCHSNAFATTTSTTSGTVWGFLWYLVALHSSNKGLS